MADANAHHFSPHSSQPLSPLPNCLPTCDLCGDRQALIDVDGHIKCSNWLCDTCECRCLVPARRPARHAGICFICCHGWDSTCERLYTWLVHYPNQQPDMPGLDQPRVDAALRVVCESARRRNVATEAASAQRLCESCADDECSH